MASNTAIEKLSSTTQMLIAQNGYPEKMMENLENNRTAKMISQHIRTQYEKAESERLQNLLLHMQDNVKQAQQRQAELANKKLFIAEPPNLNMLIDKLKPITTELQTLIKELSRIIKAMGKFFETMTDLEQAPPDVFKQAAQLQEPTQQLHEKIIPLVNELPRIEQYVEDADSALSQKAREEAGTIAAAPTAGEGEVPRA